MERSKCIWRILYEDPKSTTGHDMRRTGVKCVSCDGLQDCVNYLGGNTKARPTNITPSSQSPTRRQ